MEYYAAIKNCQQHVGNIDNKKLSITWKRYSGNIVNEKEIHKLACSPCFLKINIYVKKRKTLQTTNGSCFLVVELWVICIFKILLLLFLNIFLILYNKKTLLLMSDDFNDDNLKAKHTKKFETRQTWVWNLTQAQFSYSAPLCI